MQLNKHNFVFSFATPLVVLAVMLFLSACSKREQNTGLIQEMNSAISNHFKIQMTNSWSSVSFLKTTFSFRGRTTKFFLIQQGSQNAYEATLHQLEQKSGGPGSLVKGIVPINLSASKECSWWHPESQGVGDYCIFDTNDNYSHYWWEVCLFAKGTNYLFYSQLTVIQQ